jgi:hypothetical protein
VFKLAAPQLGRCPLGASNTRNEINCFEPWIGYVEPGTFPTTPSVTIRIDKNFDDEMRDLQAGSSSDLVAAKKDLL